MTGPESPDTPLEAAAGTAGPRAVEAFATLGNEMRLSILLALWEAYEPFGGGNALTFSELRERLGRPDSGQFNYHLDKLEPQFVRKTEAGERTDGSRGRADGRSAGGYELRRAGHQLVRTVIAGVGLEEPDLDRTELDWTCPLCDAPTESAYEDGWLLRVCTECEGQFGNTDGFPEGTLDAVEPKPAGFVGRSADEVWEAVGVSLHAEILAALEGACTTCRGPIERWLDLCEDHTTEGICPTCNRQDALLACFRCTVCKQGHGVPSTGLVRLHPAVVSFFHDHGVPLLYEAGSARNRTVGGLRPSAEITEAVLSMEPPRVRTTIEYAGERLQLTLEENLDVTDVQRG